MKTAVNSGSSIQLTAPAEGYTADQIVTVGKLVGVVQETVVQGEIVTLHLQGAYNGLPKATPQSWTQGVKLYATADGELTTTASGNTACGYALEAADSAAETGGLLLRQIA